MARQTFTTTIRVYDPSAPGYRRDETITLDYDLQAIAQWLGTRAHDSRGGQAHIMEGAIKAKTDAALRKPFPTDRRVPVDDASPTFGKAREMAQAAGKAALASLTEFEQRGYHAHVSGYPREYTPDEIDGATGHAMMRQEFARGWDMAEADSNR